MSIPFFIDISSLNISHFRLFSLFLLLLFDFHFRFLFSFFFLFILNNLIPSYSMHICIYVCVCVCVCVCVLCMMWIGFVFFCTATFVDQRPSSIRPNPPCSLPFAYYLLPIADSPGQY
jgi:hypothetical protein